ncbi:phosphoadenosine phosphosulfate reductase [Microscilla marina ATCC 23134]|uniref:Phosphoadenosine phosphosulfate reductase n=2 Tax=Microscilla marina TaxID=1027 RepID=A1ZIJ8_MICM2|nr:phosphoadenosine phosphosulfate reductase [Microscilla marina ATCC 23134]
MSKNDPTKMNIKEQVEQIKKEILEQYREEDNNRPWIIGFSGGKDSTMLLQLVWKTIQDNVPQDLRTRPIHVICNNTLVENPKILSFVERTLEKIREASLAQGMPMTVEQTTPKLESSFWVNLIGKGYPAPNTIFRWCTERLKINPTTQYIKDKISNYGEVIILLGTRSDESSQRAKNIKRHEIKGQRLRTHSLANAYAFTPIKDVLTKDVWTYLQAVNPPWEGDNKELITLYMSSSGGDCPIITDISTPSCGNSRFGCWVCTVVKRDKSMEGLIESGEDWMVPLVEIRDFLSKTVDRDHPEYDLEKYRMPIRRNNQEGPGPYWPRWRKYILEEVLKAQREIQEDQPEMVLITHQELAAIQVTWHRDFIFEFNVSDIYNDVFNRQISFNQGDENIKKEKKLLQEVCDNEGEFKLINNLLKAQKNKVLLVNKRGLQNDLEHIIEEHVYPTKTAVEGYQDGEVNFDKKEGDNGQMKLDI